MTTLSNITMDFDSIGGISWWADNSKKFPVFHNNNGPAVIYENGTKAWYVNNNRHREDGPAVEQADGQISYWFCGVQCNELEYWLKVQQRT